MSFHGSRIGVWVLLAALSGCGGSGGGGTPPDARRDAALAVSRPGELIAYVQDTLRRRAALRVASPTADFAGIGAAPALVVNASAGAPTVQRSATTVQEAGVDEDDLVKTDGSLIYALDSARSNEAGRSSPALLAHRRAADGRIELAATLLLPPGDDRSLPVTHGMHLDESARRIAVLGERITLIAGPDPCLAVADCTAGPAVLPAPAIVSSEVEVQAVEAGADATLVAGTHLAFSGRLVATRRIGSSLYIVSVHAPNLAADALPPGTPPAEREAAIAAVSARDVLPTLRVGSGAPQPLLDETDCWLQPKNASPTLEITTLTVVDLASPALAQRSRCIVGGTEAIYVSAASLVLATTRWDYPRSGPAIYPPSIQTDLHRFALAGGLPVYRASGSVVGHLGWDPQRKPYRISEHGADLRVLTFTGDTGWGIVADPSQPPSPATLTVLRENAAGGTLDVLSTLPNATRPAPIGRPGEQVRGVRFVGKRGYVVTFRQTDPLYVLDLANPADPAIVGELAVPGFSDHLFPLANGLLLGVGHEADANGRLSGVKVSLFDVSDPARPIERGSHALGAAGSLSGLDVGPHGLSRLDVGAVSRLAMPVLLVDAAGTPSRQGLQRVEVDTAAATLSLKPLLGSGTPAYSIANDRGVQVGAQVYYWSRGALTGYDW